MDPVTLGAAKADAKKRYSPLSRAAKRLIVCTTRSNHFGGGTYLNFPTSSVTSATYRTQHFLFSGVRFSGIRLVFGNYAIIPGPNDITVSAYVTYSGVGYRVTWGGSNTVAIVRGACLPPSDPLPIVLDTNVSSFVFVTTYVAGTGTPRWPVSLTITGVVGEGMTTNTDLSGCDGLGVASGLPAAPANPGSGFYAYSPVAILGIPDRPYPSPGFITDSIGVGTGDVQASTANNTLTDDYGFVRRFLNNTYGELWFAKFADTAVNMASTQGYRAHALEWATAVLDETGVNDFFASSHTTAQVAAARLTNAWTAAARGTPVYWTTVTPETSSTDSFSSVANQSTKTGESNRTGFNDWIRAGAPIDSTTKLYRALSGGAAPAGSLLIGQSGHPVSGYYEFADALETARNSGKHQAPDVKATDGAMSSTVSTNTLTCASSAPFTAGMVGQPITVAGAGGSGADLNTKITAFMSSTQVTLYDICRTTVSAAIVAINPWTFDGTHPAARGHAALAALLAADNNLLAI